MKGFVLVLSVVIGVAAAFGTAVFLSLVAVFLKQRNFLPWLNLDDSFSIAFVVCFIGFMVVIRMGVAEQYKFHFEREED